MLAEVDSVGLQMLLLVHYHLLITSWRRRRWTVSLDVDHRKRPYPIYCQ